MRRRLLIAGLAAACGLLAQTAGGPRGRGPMGMGMGPGGPGGRGPGGAGGGLGQVVTGAPYSAVEVRSTQQTLATGGAIMRTGQTTVYRDSQGRVRRETTRKTPDAQTETIVVISDPVAGVMHELNATNKTAITRKVRFPGATQSASSTAGATRGQLMGAGRRNAAVAANVKQEALAARSINPHFSQRW